MSEGSSNNNVASADHAMSKETAKQGGEEDFVSQVAELGDVIAKTNLVPGAEGQIKSQTGIDSISKEDFDKLIDSYKAEIKSLEEKLKCVSNDEALRAADENVKLKKLNHVLRSTNMDFVNKYATLSGKLEQTTKEKNSLEAEIEKLKLTAKSSPSQRHPGGDVGSASEQSKMVSDEGAGDEKLKDYLAQYFNLLQKSQGEVMQLRRLLKEADCALKNKDVHLNKANIQIQTIAQERDSYRDAVLKASHSNAQLETRVNAQQQEIIADQHKQLLVELTSKIKALEEQVKYKDDHILEQERKIEKLTLRCAEAEKFADIHGADKKRHRPPVSSNEVMQRSEEGNEAELKELKQCLNDYEKRFFEMTRDMEKMKNNKNPDAFFYNEQLKAFQEDYIAEREEKKRIIEESKRLQEDNKHLRHELQSRSSSQGHFSPPPPSTSTPFEPMQPVTPPIAHAHQQPEYPSHMQGPMPQISPHPGLQPAGYQRIYPTDYQRANTIPPRNTSGHPEPYYYASDRQFYSVQPMHNYPSDLASEPGQGYLGNTYHGPNPSGPRPIRAPSPGSTQARSPPDRHAPR